MTTRKQNTTILKTLDKELTARQQLEALKAKIEGRTLAQAEPGKPIIDPAKVAATAIDAVDHVATAVSTTVKEVLIGDNNFFTRVNLARMQRKAARGGYEKGN